MKKKLVRDNIITIIKNSGRDPVHYICSNPDDLVIFFNKKLSEEMDEYNQAEGFQKKEELADVWEVVECSIIKNIKLDPQIDINQMIQLNNYSYDEILSIKKDKQRKNGSLLNNIILTDILLH